MKNLKTMVKYSYQSPMTGQLEYLENGNLRVKNNNVDREFTADELQEIANAYKGANRIHKPMALLFWQDCKNGKYSNWKG